MDGSSGSGTPITRHPRSHLQEGARYSGREPLSANRARIVPTPLSIGFSKIAIAMIANSCRLAHPARERGVFGQLQVRLRPGMPAGETGCEQALVRSSSRANAERAQSRALSSASSCRDAAFRRGVGHLSDLTFECGDRCGVDHHAALAFRIRLVLAHVFRADAIDVERRDQIQIDDAAEVVGRCIAPSFAIVRFATPPPAVFTTKCSPPSAFTASPITFSVPS